MDFAVTEDGLRIAFACAGSGPSVLLLHGFASSAEQNWRSTGWLRVLTEAGHRVVAMDFRGHGFSDKPRDAASYGLRMLSDVQAVLDASVSGPIDIMGYSMGGNICLNLLASYPGRFRRAVVAGVGGPASPQLPVEKIARALDGGAATDPVVAQFRRFATETGKDPQALAACIRALPPRLPPAALRRIRHRVLAVCGDADTVAGAPEPLAAALGNARVLRLAGKDHMSAVGDLSFKRAVCAFFRD